MTENSGEAGVDRKLLWLAIAGGAGIIIGIVALIIAISANNATQSNAKLTAQVNQAAQHAVVGIHDQLQHDVASATTVLRALQASEAAANREHDQLRQDVNVNKSAVAVNRASIAKIETSITALTSEVHQLSEKVTKLSTNQQALTKRVDALTTSTTSTQTSST